MVAFDAQIIRWATLDAFVRHLATVPRPAWCQGITNHNTYIPNEKQWQGLASMNSMMRTYKAKVPPWSAGPHLYLAAEALHPDDRGIWQLTPLAHPGVHAGPCNENHLGVEWVGDFEARMPTAAQYALGLAVNLAICRAWGLDAGAITTHRRCMPKRTCPGRYFPFDRLRADVADRLAVSTHGLYHVAGVAVYYDSLLTRPTGEHLKEGTPITIDATAADNPTKYHPKAVHRVDAEGGGFVNGDGVERR